MSTDRSPRRHPGRAFVMGLGLAGIVVVGGCAAGSSPSSPPASGKPATIASALPSEAPSATVAFDPPVDIEAAGATRITDLGQPDWLVLAGGSAWAAGVGRGVGQLDGVTGKLLGSIAVPGSICLAMDVGFDAVWVGSCGDRPMIVRIDPRTATVVASIPLGSSGDLREESSVAAGEGGVWALTAEPEPKIVKIDPATDAVAATYDQPRGAAAIRAAYGALWVTDAPAGKLLHLDPKDASVVAEIPVGQVPRFLAVGEDGVWVMNQLDATVSHVDPMTDTVVATIPVGNGAIDGGDIAVGGGSVWVRVSDVLVVRIDPKTDMVVERYDPRSGSGSVAADDDALWVSAHDVSSVWRLPLH